MGLKLSLYEVNYNIKDSNNAGYIKVSELSSLGMGGE
jgi:hypothetical protein